VENIFNSTDIKVTKKTIFETWFEPWLNWVFNVNKRFQSFKDKPSLRKNTLA
jgi:hypothetical protein